MDLMQEIIARAKANKQRIVLPEGTEERTLNMTDHEQIEERYRRSCRHYPDWQPR